MDNLRAQFGSVDYDEDDPFGLGEDDSAGEPPPSPVGQDERRMQVRAYNHWASQLGDRSFPSIEDLDPTALTDFGPYSVLLDFTNGIDDPAIRFLGESLAGECEAGTGIGQLSDIPPRSLLSRITDHYMQILANQAPIGFEAEFVNQRGCTILYRGILLPYSSDDDTIDFIYGVINWKEMADQLTTDELLLEIDQALEVDDAARLRAADPVTDWADGPGMAQAADEPVNLQSPIADPNDRFPQPSFGIDEDEDGDEFDTVHEDANRHDLYESIEAVDEEPEGPSRFGSLLSLGGGGGIAAFDDDDDDDFGDEDEDPVAKWLGRHTPLSTEDDEVAPNDPAIDDEPYELLDEAAETDFDEPLELVAELVEQPLELGELVAEVQPYIPVEPIEIANDDGDFGSDLGIHDCLAAARELALAARTSEDRSRNALYEAVGRAYDFSLAAAAEPKEFAELVADSGLTVQERAPMTPVVKLVFGADYDKTRIAEYASVLSFAHREGVERGALSGYLSSYEGGLKGVVQAERAMRKGADAPARETPREALARKLRAIAPMGFEDIPTEGEEFAVVVIRRVAGEVVVLGEVADVPLVEKVAKKLVA